jgi:hypothetical protein
MAALGDAGGHNLSRIRLYPDGFARPSAARLVCAASSVQVAYTCEHGLGVVGLILRAPVRASARR